MPTQKDVQKKQGTKSAAAAISLTLIAASLGATGDYYLDKDVDLRVEKVTEYQYGQIKDQVYKNLKDGKEISGSDEWIINAEVLDREIKKANKSGCKKLPSSILQKTDQGVKVDTVALITYLQENC